MKIFHILWGQVCVALTTFAALRLYTATMSQSAYGEAMLILGILAFLDGLATMALNQTLISQAAQCEPGDERRQLAVGLALNCAAVIVPLGLLAALVLAGAKIALPSLPVHPAFPLFVLVYLCEECFKISLQAQMVVQRQFERLSVWGLTEAVTGVGVIYASLVFWRDDATGFLVGHVVSRLITTPLFLMLHSGGRYFRDIDLQVARRARKEALGYGLPVSAMAPLGWISTYLDRFIIAALLGTATTGLYVAATSLATRPYALTTSVLTNYFRPQLFVRKSETVDGAALERRKRKITGTWLLAAGAIGGGGALGLWLLGPWIVFIALAPDFRDGVIPLMVGCGIAQTFSIMTHAADNAILSTRRSAPLLKLQTVLSLATLTLIPLGILWHGALGAVLGRCAAELVKLLATLALGHAMLRHVPAPAATGAAP